MFKHNCVRLYTILTMFKYNHIRQYLFQNLVNAVVNLLLLRHCMHQFMPCKGVLSWEYCITIPTHVSIFCLLMSPEVPSNCFPCTFFLANVTNDFFVYLQVWVQTVRVELQLATNLTRNRICFMDLPFMNFQFTLIIENFWTQWEIFLLIILHGWNLVLFS